MLRYHADERVEPKLVVTPSLPREFCCRNPRQFIGCVGHQDVVKVALLNECQNGVGDRRRTEERASGLCRLPVHTWLPERKVSQRSRRP